MSAIEQRSASAILDREFLEIRAKILEIAASFDRLQRASSAEALEADRRRQLLDEAIHILLAGDDQRAERVQLLFSRPYSSQWPQELSLERR